LNLPSDFLVFVISFQNLLFQIQLVYRYTSAPVPGTENVLTLVAVDAFGNRLTAAAPTSTVMAVSLSGPATVGGLYKLNPAVPERSKAPDPERLQAPGFSTLEPRV
jgi:hypothetical protein